MNCSMVGSYIFCLGITLIPELWLTASFPSTRILKSQWRHWVKSERVFLHVAHYACIDLSSVQTSFAVAGALKKHRCSSLTLRTNGTNPCAMAATAISCPLQRSKAKHNNDCTGFYCEKDVWKLVILRYEVISSIEEMLATDKKQRTEVERFLSLSQRWSIYLVY